jgi:hypothetical protein
MYDGPRTTPNVGRSLDDTLPIKYEQNRFELMYNFYFSNQNQMSDLKCVNIIVSFFFL